MIVQNFITYHLPNGHLCYMAEMLLMPKTINQSTKFGTNHPWVKGIQVCSNEESI